MTIRSSKASQEDSTIETSTSAVLHRSVHETPKLSISAKGGYIYLEDGKTILDATGGAAVSCIGHNDPRVNQAIIDQLNKISYAHTAFFGSQPFEALAKTLVESTGGKMTKLLVISSGRQESYIFNNSS
jgi:adenosylmethionine-8-amino-7-oxononanoate aminotransferase